MVIDHLLNGMILQVVDHYFINNSRVDDYFNLRLDLQGIFDDNPWAITSTTLCGGAGQTSIRSLPHRKNSAEWGWNLEANDQSFKGNPKQLGTGVEVYMVVHIMGALTFIPFDAGWCINPNLSWIRFRLTYVCLKIEGSIKGILT